MARLIEWFDFTNPIERHGYSSLKELDESIKLREKIATNKVNEEGCEHVLYAIKYYDEHGKVTEVRLYMIPMTDEDLESADKTDNGHKFGHRIYAAHKQS